MNVQGPIADSARAAMKILLAENEPLEVADLVGVHNAHVYKCRASGRISPTLRQGLIDSGYIPAPPKTYAVAFHFRDESNAVALRRLFDRHGDTRREVGRKLLSGELRLTEVNDERNAD